MALPAVSYVPVIGAAVASMVIGMLWYSPLLFGKQWMKLSGISEKKAKEANMAQSMALSFAAQLVMAYVLSVFVGMMGASTLLAGAYVGVWAWAGFVATVTLGSVLWEQKPVQLWVLNAAHWLTVLVVMGAILAMYL